MERTELMKFAQLSTQCEHGGPLSVGNERNADGPVRFAVSNSLSTVIASHNVIGERKLPAH